MQKKAKPNLHSLGVLTKSSQKNYGKMKRKVKTNL